MLAQKQQEEETQSNCNRKALYVSRKRNNQSNTDYNLIQS